MGSGSSHRHRRWLRETLLNLGAVLGGGCLLLALTAVVLGVRPLVFRSASMSPAIDVGALGVARDVDARQVRVGDVVSVTDSRGLRITHRVVDRQPQGADTALVLRGDANRWPDAEPYVVQRVDRLLFSVPLAGHLVAALSSTPAVFLGGLVAGSLLVLAFRPSGPGGSSGPRRPSGRGSSSRAGRSPLTGRPAARRRLVERRAAAVGTAVLLLSVAGPGTAAAAWSDTATVSGGTVAAATRVTAPVLSCTALGVASVRFTWTAVPGASSYELAVVGSSPSTTVSTGTTVTLNGLLGSGTATVRTRVVYPATTWFSNPSNAVRYSSVVVTTCGPA